MDATKILENELRVVWLSWNQNIFYYAVTFQWCMTYCLLGLMSAGEGCQRCKKSESLRLLCLRAVQVMKSSAENWRLTLCGLVPPCGKAVGVGLHPRWQIYHARPVSRTSVSGVPTGLSRRWALTDLCLCAWDRQPGENGCLYLVGPWTTLHPVA